MPKAVLAKRGEECLPDLPLAEPKEMHRREPPGKSKERLQAAVLEWQDELPGNMAGMTGRGVGTVHRWPSKTEREGPEGRHDNKSPGRLRFLNLEQERAIGEDLAKSPRENGFGRGSRNAKVAARCMLERSGVPYGRRADVWLAHRPGFSVRKHDPFHTTAPRPRSRSGSGSARKGRRTRQPETDLPSCVIMRWPASRATRPAADVTCRRTVWRL